MPMSPWGLAQGATVVSPVPWGFLGDMEVGFPGTLG